MIQPIKLQVLQLLLCYVYDHYHQFLQNTVYVTIDRLSYWAWHCITSFIDHVIQIYIGQKDKANQWKVTVLEEFLHTVYINNSLSKL